MPPPEHSVAINDEEVEQPSTAWSDTRKCVCCRSYGRTWVLYSCSNKYGYFPLTSHIGPNWPCMLVTYAITILPLLFLTITDPSMRTYKYIVAATSIVTTVVFSMVACSDPGVVFESYEPVAPSPSLTSLSGDVHAVQTVVCAKCHMRRPINASHCSDCDVCVTELDHHCPWTGKCIGKRTLVLFYTFLVCITCHLMAVAIIGTLACVTYKT